MEGKSDKNEVAYFGFPLHQKKSGFVIISWKHCKSQAVSVES